MCVKGKIKILDVNCEPLSNITLSLPGLVWIKSVNADISWACMHRYGDWQDSDALHICPI